MLYRQNDKDLTMAFICSDCPRKCGVDREKNRGFCSCGVFPHISRAAAHFGEEPCISGSRGSGAVFFSGCNLKCSFCQNHEISRVEFGKETDIPAFREMLLRLQDTGVHNINLVTGTHFVRFVAEALSGLSLSIPVVWNSSGYESVESLRMLDGLVQVYMPDYKYADHVLAKRYSLAEDYPEVALQAIGEMIRQRSSCIFDEDGLLVSGVLIRHLILPGHPENSMDCMDAIADAYDVNSVLFSLMSQFTPMADCDIKERVSAEENQSLIHYMKLRGYSGYTQEICSSTDEMIPEFNMTGV